MACNCGKSKSRVAYQVRFRDGTTAVYPTSTEAGMAIRAKGGGVMKAVPAK